MVTSARNSTF